MTYARPNSVIRSWSLPAGQRGDGASLFTEAWDPLLAHRRIAARIVEAAWTERRTLTAQGVSMDRAVLADPATIAQRGVTPAPGQIITVSMLDESGMARASGTRLVILSVIVESGAGTPGSIAVTRLLCGRAE